MKNIAYIFIDEFKDGSLPECQYGNNDYFIYTAVVVNEKDLSTFRDVHKEIVKKHFQAGFIKSSNIKNNLNGIIKRRKVANKLNILDHYIVSLIIDKSKLNEKWAENDQVFEKFFNYILNERFLKIYNEVHVYLDKTGYPKFQNSFKIYMQKKGYEPTLFGNNTFELKDDILEEPLLQIADFYSGCIGKYFRKAECDNEIESVYDILKNRLLIDYYPKERINYFGAQTLELKFYNKTIHDIAIYSAEYFLKNNPKDHVGCEIVSLLLLEAINNPLKIISTKEIFRKLEISGLSITNPINEMARLRDKKVFVVSPIGKKGYKLPCNEQEIAEFYDRFTSNIIPMLKRVGILNQILLEQSFGKYNTLGRDEYKMLKMLVDSLLYNEQ